MDKMISEIVSPKNVLTLAQRIFSKNDRKKNYTIKVSIFWKIITM